MGAHRAFLVIFWVFQRARQKTMSGFFLWKSSVKVRPKYSTWAVLYCHIRNWVAHFSWAEAFFSCIVGLGACREQNWDAGKIFRRLWRHIKAKRWLTWQGVFLLYKLERRSFFWKFWENANFCAIQTYISRPKLLSSNLWEALDLNDREMWKYGRTKSVFGNFLGKEIYR